MGARALFRTFFNNAVVVMIVAAALLITKPFGSPLAIDFGPYLAEWKVMALAAAASFAGIVSSAMGQYAYANEKAGILAPYAETGRLLTVVAGFFVLGNSSVPALFSALVAVGAILACSVDFRSFSVNRYCGILAASGVLRAFSALAIGYLAARATPFTITLFDVSLAAAACLPALAYLRGFPKFDRPKFRRLFGWTFVNDAIWLATFVISLFLLKDLGIVKASLLGMLALVLTVAADAGISRRLPDRRTASLVTVVAACVAFGSFYR